MFGEEAVDVAAEVFEDDLGDVGGEDDAEAGVADVPAHDVLGVAIEGGAGGEDLRACARAAWGAGFVAGEDDGGAAVAEEAAGDEVGDGLVVVLPGEGAELDGEEEGDLRWGRRGGSRRRARCRRLRRRSRGRRWGCV